MKSLFMFSVVVVLFSCDQLKQDKVQPFMPGIYVRDIADEYTTGRDTLIIRISDPRLNVYQIEKRMRYQQQLDGKLLPPEQKVENWTATYDRENGQLHEQRKGKVLSFYPEQNKVSLGGSEYEKITSP